MQSTEKLSDLDKIMTIKNFNRKNIMKITTKYFIIALIAGTASFALSSCSKTEGETAKTVEVFTIKTGTVEMAQMTATFKATGTLEGIREANVNSETQGRILNVAVNNGSRVGQGAALV